MNSDTELRYHEREHATYMVEEARCASFTDMDVLRMMAFDRAAKAPADNPLARIFEDWRDDFEVQKSIL